MIPIEANGHAYSDSLGDNPGTWCAGNPTVWGVLEPVLKLASRFLSNIQTNILVHCISVKSLGIFADEKIGR